MPNWYFNDELKNGEIIRLLPQYSPHPLPINAIYPTSRKHSAKVAAFIQFTRQLMVWLNTSPVPATATAVRDAHPKRACQIMLICLSEASENS
jgi:hypothetical protein